MAQEHNEHAAHCLLGILETKRWTETHLAQLAGLSRSVVCAHLSGRRVIRRHHLSRYLAIIGTAARIELLLAWLRDDGFPGELIDALIHLLND